MEGIICLFSEMVPKLIYLKLGPMRALAVDKYLASSFDLVLLFTWQLRQVGVLPQSPAPFEKIIQQYADSFAQHSNVVTWARLFGRRRENPWNLRSALQISFIDGEHEELCRRDVATSTLSRVAQGQEDIQRSSSRRSLKTVGCQTEQAVILFGS